MPRRFALLGALASCAILLAGCVVAQPQPDGTVKFSLFPPSQQTTVSGGSASQKAQAKGNTPRLAQPGKPVMPGSSQTSGAWKVTVTTTHMPDQLADGSKPKSGNKFLVVDVSIQNVAGGNYLTVTPNQFALWDPNNKVVDPYPTKFTAYNAQGVRPVAAGYGGYTSFVYSVPNTDVVYTFTFTPGQQGTKPMSWYVP